MTVHTTCSGYDGAWSIGLRGLAREPARVRWSAKTIRADSVDQAPVRYKRAARLPASPWTFGTNFPKQGTASFGLDAGLFVAVVRTPMRMTNALRAWTFDSDPTLTGAKYMAEELHCQFGQPGTAWRLQGFGRLPPGQVTTTRDLADGRYLGLHIDSWYDLPLSKRNTSPNRLCVNLGDDTRHFLFVPLSLIEMAKALAAEELPFGMDANDIGSTFLHHFPNQLVISIDVHPGEGYIAPTEAILHDGSTEGTTSDDAFVTLLGHFAAPDWPR